MVNKRLGEIQIKDLLYVKYMLEDVINGATDSIEDDIRILRDISMKSSYVSGELEGI